MTKKAHKTVGIVGVSIGVPTIIAIITWFMGAGEFVAKVPANEIRSKDNAAKIEVVEKDQAVSDAIQEERHKAVMQGFDRLYKAIDK